MELSHLDLLELDIDTRIRDLREDALALPQDQPLFESALSLIFRSFNRGIDDAQTEEDRGKLHADHGYSAQGTVIAGGMLSELLDDAVAVEHWDDETLAAFLRHAYVVGYSLSLTCREEREERPMPLHCLHPPGEPCWRDLSEIQKQAIVEEWEEKKLFWWLEQRPSAPASEDVNTSVRNYLMVLWALSGIILLCYNLVTNL